MTQREAIIFAAQLIVEDMMVRRERARKGTEQLHTPS